MNFKISKILAKDLLQERSRCIKDGQLIFNRVAVTSTGIDQGVINLYYDNDFLASIKLDCCPGSYTTFNFQLDDSNMKLRFEDKDICDLPNSTPLEKIEDAAIEIMKSIKSLKRSIDSEQ